jgi:hypothetical protein
VTTQQPATTRKSEAKDSPTDFLVLRVIIILLFCALVTIDIWRDSLGVFVASVMISLTRSTVQLYTTSHSSRGQWWYWTRVRPCFFSSCCFSNIFIFIERRRHRAWKIRKVKKERERNTPAVTIRTAKNENDGQFGRNNKRNTADSFLKERKRRRKKKVHPPRKRWWKRARNNHSVCVCVCLYGLDARQDYGSRNEKSSSPVLHIDNLSTHARNARPNYILFLSLDYTESARS